MLYIIKEDFDLTIIFFFVDDSLLTESNLDLIKLLETEMMEVFEMTNLGEMFYFFGMKIQQKGHEIFLCHQKYAKENLIKFKMKECKSTATTLMSQMEKFCKEDGAGKVDEALYKRLIGCLMYLNATRPDILYVCEFIFKIYAFASEVHFQVAKHVIRYVKDTANFGIMFK